MAYAAIVSLSQILEQVTDVDQRQIKSLHEKLCFLQSFMEDSHIYNGENFEPLEEQIRDAVYEAEDVVELHILNRVRSGRSLVFKYARMPFLWKRYQNDLRRLNEKIDSIVEEAMKIKKSYEDETLIPRGVGSSSRQPPISCRSTVVGIHDGDLLEMKARLCGDSSKLDIISIVGMGGIGKTTLAKTIFDDSLIAECFNFRAWVTISQEYCIRDIFLGLLNSLSALTDDLSANSDAILAERVYKSLKGRRYLVVMDDMWSTKVWDETRRLLPDDNNGSRIIITSRLLEVGCYADSSSPLHHMQLLNVDQSWSLLQQKIFKRGSCPLELQEIGKTIAGKCGGLPLAIVLVAGILSKVYGTLDDWEKFADKVSSTLETNDEFLFTVFSLSYNNLPHHLRACFLYMGGFPEDHEIRISKLARLWTAEGFLKPITSKSAEEAAEEYVGDLVKRNLISIAETKANGRLKSCRIHDLLWDFSIRKARDENFLYVMKDGYASQEVIYNKRRLCNYTKCYVPTTRSDRSIRTLLFSNNDYRYLTSLALSFKLLRVLDDGRSSRLSNFPPEVTELTHLRYLSFFQDLRYRFVFPARKLNLRHLQTLIIESDPKFIIPRYYLSHNVTVLLPPEIWEMPKLRHLVVDNGCLLSVPFSTISDGKVHSLNNLYTLSTVVDFCFAKETIERIPNLKKLGIIYYVHEESPVIEWSKYQLSNLIHLRQLETLTIVCERRYFVSLEETNFSRSFALPLKLKKLDLFGCTLSPRNLETIGQLRNLEVLKLRHCEFVDKDWKMNEGEFVQLKYLLMRFVNIKCWHVESAELRNLEQLVINYCRNLQEIPCEIGDIPTLQYIKVIGGLDSLRASAIQIQEEQLSLGNDSLRVDVKPLPAGVSP